MALQAAGGILMGGNFATVGGHPRDRIARLQGNGHVDSTFLAAAARTRSPRCANQGACKCSLRPRQSMVTMK